MHRNRNFVFGRERDVCLEGFQFYCHFFRLSFFSFSRLFVVVVDLFSGLASNFTKSSLQFLSIFVHISSGSSDEITGYHQKDLESESDANFGQR